LQLAKYTIESDRCLVSIEVQAEKEMQLSEMQTPMRNEIEAKTQN